MKRALEGLDGVRGVDMDVARDLFHVTAESGEKPGERRVLEAVRAVGYRPSIVDPSSFEERGHLAGGTGPTPRLIADALKRARADGKSYVLVDCMAPT